MRRSLHRRARHGHGRRLHARRWRTSAAGGVRQSAFECAQSIHEIAERDERLEGRDIDQCEVEHQTRLLGTTEFVATTQHAFEHLRHPRPGQRLRLHGEFRAFFVGRVDKFGELGDIVGVAPTLQHGQIAQGAHHGARDLHFVDTAIDRSIDRRQRRASITAGQTFDHRARQCAVGDAENFGDVGFGDRRITDIRNNLIR